MHVTVKLRNPSLLWNTGGLLNNRACWQTASRNHDMPSQGRRTTQNVLTFPQASWIVLSVFISVSFVRGTSSSLFFCIYSCSLCVIHFLLWDFFVGLSQLTLVEKHGRTDFDAVREITFRKKIWLLGKILGCCAWLPGYCYCKTSRPVECYVSLFLHLYFL